LIPHSHCSLFASSTDPSALSDDFALEYGWFKHSGLGTKADQPSLHFAEVGNLEVQNNAPVPIVRDALARVPRPLADVRCCDFENLICTSCGVEAFRAALVNNNVGMLI